jgi:predicted nucleic acid-binding protein
MTPTVIDANVAIKLFFEEEDSDVAELCMKQAELPTAPDIIWAETANVIWKRRRRGDINADTALAINQQVMVLPIQLRPSAELVPEALNLAVQYDRTVYDCLYLALAMKSDGVLFTADQRLVNALARGPLAKYVRWIGELKRPSRR